MALALAYQNAPQKTVVDRLVIGHFDGHGTATVAARLRVLRQRGERVVAVVRYPATGPSPQFPQLVDELRSRYEAKVAEVIDIPINVKSPDLHIDAESRLPATTVYHYDHHETSMPFIPRLASKGVIPVIVRTATDLALALELLGDQVAKELAVVGIVADRDPSVLSIVSREEVESRYIELANMLDILVRNPSVLGFQDQGQLAEALSSDGVSLLHRSHIDYPPRRLADNVAILERGSVAILADFEQVEPQWAPKTAEEVLRRHGRHYIVFVAPALDPRTRQRVGYDVRILQYWLSEMRPEPEQIVQDLIQQFAVHGNVVGHGRYVSLRLEGASKADAVRIARTVYERIEGRVSAVTHLVSDQYVAQAVQRDYQRIIELLERIATALERGASAKEEQVQLLRELYRSEPRTRYD